MAKIHYARVDEFWRKEEKYAYLDEKQHAGNVRWQELHPDLKGNWLTEGMREDFETFMPIGSKEGKRSKAPDLEVMFGSYSRGISTSRDEWVYDFDRDELEKKILSHRKLQFGSCEILAGRQSNQSRQVC